ncbi:hypothetical protein NC652_013586 [Populus alba x Populus x berolinensis]|nr:hypothetical protein NC652_013586 [Populus alba x Populus x berolinensis]
MHTRFILCIYYLPSRCLWLWIFAVHAFAEVSAEFFIFICFCAALLCTFILAFQVSYYIFNRHLLSFSMQNSLVFLS